MTGGILLAAGESRRFGGEKQLAVWRGKTLLERSAEMLVEAGLAPRIVVLGTEERRHRAVLAGMDVETVVNSAAAEGISGSIRVGLRAALAADPELAGIVITVCDQPYCTAEHLRKLVETAAVSGEEIVASEYAGVAGVPVFFGRNAFSELEKLRGDRGAAAVVRGFSRGFRVVSIEKGEADVDTAEDLERLQ